MSQLPWISGNGGNCDVTWVDDPPKIAGRYTKECAAEMMEYGTTGQSVMEMSHRSKAYEPIIQDAEAMVRKLMKVPSNYKILFVQGGGSTQFAMVAQNLGIKNKKAAYIETGVWAKKAAAEAKKLGVAVDVIASSKDKNYSYIPKVEKIEVDDPPKIAGRYTLGGNQPHGGLRQR